MGLPPSYSLVQLNVIYEESAETKFKLVGVSGGAAGVTANGLD